MRKIIIPLALLSASTYAATPSTFTPEQEAQIGKIAAQYLVEHPDFLVKAGQKLQQQQAKQHKIQQKQAVLSHKKELLNAVGTPFVGSKKAKVNVIEFFDYQCAYCVKIAPTIENLQKKHPNIKFIYKETPIFASRWEPSKYAAQMGLEIFAKKGTTAYNQYHYSVFKTGLNEGKLTKKVVDKKAHEVGFSATLTPTDTYKKNIKLFSELEFRGTPAFVVMPTTGATVDNVYVINGADSHALTEAISTLSK